MPDFSSQLVPRRLIVARPPRLIIGARGKTRVRPDGYVAWVAEGCAETLHEALTTWCGATATAVR